MSNQDFYKKVITLQQKVKVPKSNYNDFGKYSYKTAADILLALKKESLPLGLWINITDEILLVGDRYYVKATVTISDGSQEIKSSAMARESLTKKGMDDAQITGATSSYARKFALAGILGLDDEEDPDMRDNSDEENVQVNEKTREQLKAEAVAALKSRLREMNKEEKGVLEYLSTKYKRAVTLENITPEEYDHAMSFLKPVNGAKK